MDPVGYSHSAAASDTSTTFDWPVKNVWMTARASHGVGEGSVFYEATVKGTGICRVGWSTERSCLELGYDEGSFGYGGTGMKSNAGVFTQYGEEFGNGDIIGCALDIGDEHISISFFKNGKTHMPQGVAYRLLRKHDATFFPTFAIKGASQLVLNFGDASFCFAPPEGFSGIQAAARKLRLQRSRAVDMQVDPHQVFLALAGRAVEASNASGEHMEIAMRGVCIFLEELRVVLGEIFLHSVFCMQVANCGIRTVQKKDTLMHIATRQNSIALVRAFIFHGRGAGVKLRNVWGKLPAEVVSIEPRTKELLDLLVKVVAEDGSAERSPLYSAELRAWRWFNRKAFVSFWYGLQPHVDRHLALEYARQKDGNLADPTDMTEYDDFCQRFCANKAVTVLCNETYGLLVNSFL